MRFWLHEKTARGQASDCKKILFYFFVYLTGSGSEHRAAFFYGFVHVFFIGKLQVEIEQKYNQETLSIE